MKAVLALLVLFVSSVAFAQSVPTLPTTPQASTGLLAFLVANGSLIFGVLLGISETLSLIPSIKANGIFQLIFNTLQSLKNSVFNTPPKA